MSRDFWAPPFPRFRNVRSRLRGGFVGIASLLLLSACGSDSTKTVTLRTGLEGTGSSANLMKLWAPMALVSTPVPTCKQMDVRIGYGTPGGTPTMLPVEAASTDLYSATTLSAIVSGIRIPPIRLKLPRNQPQRVVFLASITQGFDAGEPCPRLSPGGGAFPTYSFRGAREFTVNQQEVIDLRVWGLQYTGYTPSTTVCPGGDCPASHFIKVTPTTSALSNQHLVIEFNPDLGFPARQVLPDSGDFHIPRARTYRISKFTHTGPDADTLTPCTTPLTQQSINDAGAGGFAYTPPSTDPCYFTGYSTAKFSNP